MKVYKHVYKDKKTGKKKKCKRFLVDFFDNNHHRRKLLAFSNNQQSNRVAEKIELLLACRGRILDPDLSKWLTQIPQKMYKQLVDWDMLDARQVAAGKPLAEHIEDFKSSLSAKGNTEKHVHIITSRVNRVIKKCKFTIWDDISASRVQQKISSLRNYVEVVEMKEVDGKKVKTKKKKDLDEISAQTYNHYLQAIKQFCKWMVQDRRAIESPLEHLQGINVKADLRHDRRSLEPDEIRLLLETTRYQPKRFGMTGYERALLYRLTVETGLRRDELDSLKKSSFNFDTCTVTVEPGYTKNKKIAILPLRKDTATELQVFLSSKMPTTKAFKVPVKTADMIKEDLTAAGIPYVDDAGRFADFHSLRHSTGSLLAAAGVHPKVIQTIMRHSDINLTMSRYTHIFQGQETEAVAKIPDLSLPSKKKQMAVATGTDNARPSDSTYTRQTCVQKRLPANSGEQENHDNDSETAFLTTPERTRTSDLRFRNTRLWS